MHIVHPIPRDVPRASVSIKEKRPAFVCRLGQAVPSCYGAEIVDVKDTWNVEDRGVERGPVVAVEVAQYMLVSLMAI